MMMIVIVRLIWLGTIVTWLSCRPLVLFSNKITMGILTGYRHSHGHRKSVSSVFTCCHKLQLVRLQQQASGLVILQFRVEPKVHLQQNMDNSSYFVQLSYKFIAYYFLLCQCDGNNLPDWILTLIHVTPPQYSQF